MSVVINIPSAIVERSEKGDKLYTSYQIICQSSLPDYPPHECKVNRRYNDFLWLYKRLSDEYELTKHRKDPINPPTKPPPKKPFGRFKDSFIEQRRSDLETWLRGLCTHPVWPTLKPFRLFITEPNMMGVIRY